MQKKNIFKNMFSMMFVALLALVLVACGNKDQELVDKVLAKIETEAVVLAQGDKLDAVSKNIELKTELEGVTIGWQSSNDKVVSSTGNVTRQDKDEVVILTATLTLNKATASTDVTVKVIKKDMIDTLAPVFQGLVDGKYPAITHLQFEELAEGAMLNGVTAIDNVDAFDVTITVSDMGTYNKDVAGTHTVTIEAVDKAGNKTSVTRDIVVEEALNVTLAAAVIGNNFIQYEYNNTDAFVKGADGAIFRFKDVLQVMTKEFFFAEMAAHGEEYGAGAIPLLPYGSLMVIDGETGKILHARIQTGVFLQLDSEGVLTHTDVPWNIPNGGNTLLGLYAEETMDDEGNVLPGYVIPEGALVVFAGTPEPQAARKFIVSSIFNSKYERGVNYATDRDITEEQFKELKFETIEEYTVNIPKPEALATPEINLELHTISWTAISGALGYEVYVDGEIYGDGVLFTQTSIKLNELELEYDKEVEVTIKAVPMDIFKASASEISNGIKYTRRELKPLETPVVTAEGDLLSWGAIEGATEYKVYVLVSTADAAVNNLRLLTTTTETSIDLSEFNHLTLGFVRYRVEAIGNPDEVLPSLRGEFEMTRDFQGSTITVGNSEFDYITMDASLYFLKRNEGTDSAFRIKASAYLLENVFELKGLFGSGIYAENNTTLLLLDKDNNVKYAKLILGDEFINGVWTDSADLSLAAMNDLIEEGDRLLIGRTGYNVEMRTTTEVEGEVVVNKQTAAGREVLAYLFIVKWSNFPAAPTGTDGWRGDVATYANPNDIEFTINEVK